MRLFFTLAILWLSLASCNNNNGVVTLKESTGRINHLTIVIDNELWQGVVGDSLREIIANPVLGLPQDEAQFSITQVPRKTFGKLFRSNRNILFVGIEDGKEGYGVKNDIYSSPQVTMTIVGTDKANLIKQIMGHRKDIISVFRESDLKLYQKKVTKNYWEPKDIKTLSNFDVRLKIPNKYALVDDTGDFLWFRTNIEKGSMNIIAYTLDLGANDSIVNNIVAARNSIGRKYIPGQFDGTYMITEAAYTPFTKSTEFKGKPSYETRGKWEVHGDFMAGPFLNYTIVDKAKNRLLVLEGFTYAPSVDKRDFMFELEAILKTLEI